MRENVWNPEKIVYHTNMVWISRIHRPSSELIARSDSMDAYGFRPIDQASHLVRAKVAALVLKYGKLINIWDIDPTIQVDLKYAKIDNFAGKAFYPPDMKALLRYEVAVMLHRAQVYLKQKKWDAYSLVVYDAGRPQSSHEEMYAWAESHNKTDYFAWPKWWSIHSFGCAVDVSIMKGKEPLDMGTWFDALDDASGTTPEWEEALVLSWKLTRKHIEHRDLLREVMWVWWFSGIDSEWWHYETSSNSEMWKQIRRDFERIV